MADALAAGTNPGQIGVLTLSRSLREYKIVNQSVNQSWLGPDFLRLRHVVVERMTKEEF